ncbi:MAG: C40 family peptidase [Oscillospiraceae bacterium]|nr:C40 family peptidase [Oscillospiraceae bacterium]
MILILACAFLLIVVLQSCMGALTTIGNGMISVVGGTSYVATDEDIEAVESNYTALEKALRDKLARIERDYPSYDEYRYSVDEIGHDPFELASYLTAKYDDYTPAQVQAELQSLIKQQYTLTITQTVEVRYRTETRTDTWTDEDGNSHSDTYTVEVPYNYYILNVSLRNHSLGAVALANLNPEQTERYLIYQKTKGNRPNLFEGNIYTHPGEYTDYDIPPEALSDPAFAALIAEAEKYLGYPYVWGGSSPSTSFDCSGFVSWVVNHSGWNVGRLGAQGLFNICTPVSSANARPGDLIFFVGTYDTPGVSHVGIYVGGGMMLHCGNPISYTSIETNYWQSHYYSFERLP